MAGSSSPAPSGALPSLAVVMRYLDPFATSTDYVLGHLPYLDDAARSLSLPRRYLSLGIAALLASFVLFALTAMLLCTAVAVLYPAYMTMKALEARPLQMDCMVQWLTYWVCYALFSIVELFGDHLLYWFPFYYLIKVAFLVWLMHPSTKGAQYLYDSHLHALFARYSGAIDYGLARLSTGAGTAGAVAGRVANVVLSEASRAAAAGGGSSPGSAEAAQVTPPVLHPDNIFGSIRTGQHSE